jgi:hypothetical protein
MIGTLAQFNPGSGIPQHRIHEFARLRRRINCGRQDGGKGPAAKCSYEKEQESLELMKIKEWPIVLTCSLHYLCRTGGWLALLPFYSLDQLKAPEVVKICDAQCETINIGDNERSDLPLLHEYQGGGGEGSAVDGAKAEIHDLVGNAVVNSRAVAFEQETKVPIGDHAD